MNTESAIEHKELALGAFLDIERAFDRISFDAITQNAEMHGIDTTICRWILFILESRNIITTFSGEILRASTAKKCPQSLCFCLCCGAWLWVNFYGDLIMMIIIQDMQTILQS
jgi:hypothetical protein